LIEVQIPDAAERRFGVGLVLFGVVTAAKLTALLLKAGQSRPLPASLRSRPMA
jgi:hypothetical protein